MKAQVLTVAAALLSLESVSNSSPSSPVREAAVALIGNILSAMTEGNSPQPQQPGPVPVHPGLKLAAVKVRSALRR